MCKLLCSVLILFFLCPLQATVDFSNVTFGGDINGLFEEHASVVTGQFVDRRRDLLLDGCEPIYLESTYAGPAPKLGSPFGSFMMLPQLNLFLVEKQKEKMGNGVALTHKNLLYATYENGLSLVYLLQTGKGWKKCPLLTPTFGMTNTFLGEPSGQTNILNNTVSYSEKTRRIEIQLGNGTRRLYAKKGKVGKSILFCLMEETLPNGAIREYHYDQEHRVKQIVAKTPNRDKTYGHVDFFYDKDRLTIRNSHGKFHHYRFVSHQHPSQTTYQLLEEVNCAYQPKNCYYYRQKGAGKPCFPTGVDFFNGKQIEVQYYDQAEGLLKDRIEKLVAPVAPDGRMTHTHRFVYHLPGLGQPSRAEVIFANGGRMGYQISPEYNLLSLARRDEKKQFLYKCRFQWALLRGGLAQIRSKLTTCKDDKAVHLKTEYEYDDYGNVVCERYWGAFSGNGPIAERSGEMGLKGAEKRVIRRSYTQDGRNRLSRLIHPAGDYEVFDYFADTQLISKQCHFTSDHKLISRKQYTYNSDHILTKMSEDDGVNGSCVTEITPTLSQNGLNLPHIITKYAVDRATHQKLMLGKKERKYTREGWLSSESVFDAAGVLRYTLIYKYDPMGHCIYETDPVGQVTKRTYDQFGNCLTEDHSEQGIKITNCYDKANRLISKTIDAAGEKRTTTYTYTERNLVASETNYQGKTKFYTYDSQDNCIRTQYGKQVEEKVYDAFSKPIIERDSLGNETRYKYNSFGDVIEETTPDGAVTKTTYNPDRTVATKILPNKTVEVFTYDTAKHLICRALYEGDQLLYDQKYLYRGNLLVEEIDAEGVSTRYAHDAAGRVIKKRKENAREQYDYDALGHLARTKIATCSSPICTHKKYDHLGRVVEEKTESEESVVNHRVTIYDVWGNVSVKKTITANRPLVERSTYDALGRVTKQIDPAGSITCYRYVQLPGKVRCDQTTVISPKKIQTVQTFNEEDQLVSEKVIDAEGRVLRHEKYAYDSEGRKIVQESLVYLEGVHLDTYITRWGYDACGRVIEIVEGDRKTKMVYTYDHQLKEVHKASGVTLTYTYDAARRLKTVLSSDQSIRYCYTYDKKGRMVAICSPDGDHYLTYDAHDRVVEERLATGHILKTLYDSAGRKTALILPDGSRIDYGYRGVHLHTLSRGERVHTYNAYDPSGPCLKETSIDGSCNSYTLDRLGRIDSHDHPYVDQAITKVDEEGLPLEARIVIKPDEYSMHYSYDKLNQLSSEHSEVSHTYRFDSHGNIRHLDEQECTITPNHKLTQFKEDSIAYDKNGNRQTACKATYTYDALDRLKTVQTDTQKITYIYDAKHRLIRSITNEKTRDFLYDDQCEIGSMENGSIKELRILGSTDLGEIGSTAWVEIDSYPYVTLHDLYGNIMMYIDAESGGISQIYFYSAFGEKKLLKPGYFWTTEFPWTFQSKREEKATQLIHFGRRFYDPHTLAFINPDPKGLSDIPNPYCYLDNNPLLHYDPWGLEAIERNWQRHPAYQTSLGMADGASRFAVDTTFGLSHLAAYAGGLVLPRTMTNNLHNLLERGQSLTTEAIHHGLKTHLGGDLSSSHFHNGSQGVYKGMAIGTLAAGAGAAKKLATSAIAAGSRLPSLRSVGSWARNQWAGTKNLVKGAFQNRGSANANHLNPFRGKTFKEIDSMLIRKGFFTRGPDPMNGKGSYFSPTTKRKYYLDSAGKRYKGGITELPHVDVHYNVPVNGIEKKRFPLGKNLYELE